MAKKTVNQELWGIDMNGKPLYLGDTDIDDPVERETAENCSRDGIV